MDTETKRRIQSELQRVAVHALTIAATSAVVGVVIAASPALYIADRGGDLTMTAVRVLLWNGARLGLDIGVIAAFLAVTFLRAVSLRRAAAWIAVGMFAGSIIGAVLTFSVEISAWTTAYMIGGAIVGLVATCVRLWGAERASRRLAVL